MFNAYRKRYEELILEQKRKIEELAKENTRLQAEVSGYKDKEQLIYLTLARAEKNALDIKELAQAEYALEIEKLKKFSEKWEGYFKQLEEKYPYYPTTKVALDINERIKAISGEDGKKDIESIDSMLPNEKFNPKEKIADYIVATQTSGFNMDDVLHPGELELEEICKELGLMGENE